MKIKYRVKPIDLYNTWKKGDVIYWKEPFDDWDRQHFIKDRLKKDTAYRIRHISYQDNGKYEGQYLLSFIESNGRDYSAGSFTKIKKNENQLSN